MKERIEQTRSSMLDILVCNRLSLMGTACFTRDTPYDNIKQQLLQEYSNNRAHYTTTAEIKRDEIMRYLQSHNYNLDAVDSMIDMICSASIYIIGNKFDYSDLKIYPKNIFPVYKN